MRTPTIIQGFKNSQRFRFILSTAGGAEFAMYATIQQMTQDICLTDTRVMIWLALERLARDRACAQRENRTLPRGLVTSDNAGNSGFHQVQIDLVDLR